MHNHETSGEALAATFEISLLRPQHPKKGSSNWHNVGHTIYSFPACRSSSRNSMSAWSWGRLAARLAARRWGPLKHLTGTAFSVLRDVAAASALSKGGAPGTPR